MDHNRPRQPYKWHRRRANHPSWGDTLLICIFIYKGEIELKSPKPALKLCVCAAQMHPVRFRIFYRPTPTTQSTPIIPYPFSSRFTLQNPSSSSHPTVPRAAHSNAPSYRISSVLDNRQFSIRFLPYLGQLVVADGDQLRVHLGEGDADDRPARRPLQYEEVTVG